MTMHPLLQHLSKHIRLSQEESEYFLSRLSSRKLEPGDYLLREGEVCKQKTFVVQGCLKIFSVDDTGEEHVIDFCIEDWWADDLYSLLTQSASTINIRAMEPTEILQISAANLDLLYQQVPAFERFFRILYQNAFIAQQEQINGALAASAEDRYRQFLAKKPYAEKRFPQKDIASYLGITPQFFSAMKKKMR